MKCLKELIAVMVLGSASVTYAAWMQGEVVSVNPQEKKLTIERANAQYQEAYDKNIEVKVLDNAKLKNVASLNEIKEGQEVKLDARANKEQGHWDANYVELIDSDADIKEPQSPDTTQK